MNKVQLSDKIGLNIKNIRIQKGINQSELARLCFKDRQAIEKIENGKVNPTIYSLYQIALALKVELKDLINL